ncbi:molybdate transport system ATP-binding protein [Thermosulfidibacter takaii ABI70S6]|uniref:Molybdate transport system ATP-binding protein n=1 Tax=Thermosulfidibacter takaii (strain DSM 17441 / JCM 13301 / NBRC 103674 / ABI70S6) TaxID=1298851 RepID=A0A0S3QRE1_THET7|nr:ATP-binding cassette domain-containing protein [Thermosulfidibacter takaii]BAT70895.1 molybdate transport system ATP-binding protein [Thermosulfidibacter takaii ABI70S6]
MPGFELDVAWETGNAIMAIWGPSGSGKSLTLKAIAGLIKPDSGRIAVGDTVFFDSAEGVNLPPQNRRVGYLPQHHALFPHLRVYENIVYGKCVDKAWVQRLMEIMEIDRLVDRFPKELSGGERQRVALLRALATEPKLLLLDEPFSALHWSLRKRLLGEIRRIKRELNIPVIMVSHDINEVFELADEVVVYVRGRVKQRGDVYQVYFKPCDLLVAQLLGHENFVRVRVSAKGRGWVKVVLPTSQSVVLHQNYDGPEDAVLLVPSCSLALKKDSYTVKVLLRVLDVRRQGEDVVVELGEEGWGHLVFRIPSALTPNFILEPGRSTEFFFNTKLFHLLPNRGG